MPAANRRAKRMLVFTVLVSLCAAADPASAFLVAHWRFDEPAGSTAALDETGGHDGAVIGDAAFGVVGVAGRALALGFGGGGALDMGDVLPFQDEDFSLVVWVKTLPGAADVMYPVSKHVSGFGGYLVGLNTDGVYGAPGKAWFYDIGAPGEQAFSTTDINDGQWHQIACAYQQGGLLGIYVDGTPREDLHDGPMNPLTAAKFVVGGYDDGGAVHAGFQGWIDDVQVYDHTLHPDQVGFLFANPSYVLGEIGVHPVAQGLRLWLRADSVKPVGDQQPVALWPDRSGQGLHVAQADPASRPRYVTGSMHAFPAVHFDGNDFLIRDNVAGSSLMSADEATVYLVARQDGADAYNTVLGWGYTSNRLLVHYTWEGWLVFQHGPPTSIGGNGVWPSPVGWNDAFHFVELRRENGTFSCVIDGADQGDQATIGAPNLESVQPLLVGSDAYRFSDMTGDISEILVYDRALTPLERDSMQLYFESYYYPTTVGAEATPASRPALEVAPNPFNPRTVVAFTLPQAGEVAVAVHDVQGRLVCRLAGGRFAAGRHELVWDGRDDRGREAGAGVYLVRLTAPLGGAVTRVVLIK